MARQANIGAQIEARHGFTRDGGPIWGRDPS